MRQLFSNVFWFRCLCWRMAAVTICSSVVLLISTSVISSAHEEEVCGGHAYDGVFVTFHEQPSLSDVKSGKAFGGDTRFRVLRAFKNYSARGTERFLVQFAYTGISCIDAVLELEKLPNIANAVPNKLF